MGHAEKGVPDSRLQGGLVWVAPQAPQPQLPLDISPLYYVHISSSLRDPASPAPLAPHAHTVVPVLQS